MQPDVSDMSCFLLHSMQPNASDMSHAFYCIIRKFSKLSKKTDFLAHFWRFFLYTLLHPMSYTPLFRQLKRLMEAHNPSKFH